MSQSYDIPSSSKSTSAKIPQSGGHPSRGRSMSPDTAKSGDRRYRSRSPLRAMSPSGGRSSASGSEVMSQPGHLQNSQQDMESPWASLNESISSEPATDHETVDPPLTTVSPTNASSSPTPPEPAPLSEEEHRKLAYENLLKENLRRKNINDQAFEKTRAKLDEATNAYMAIEAEFRHLTRVVDFRFKGHGRRFGTRRSFIRNKKLTARRGRMAVRCDRAKHRHDIALTRWLMASVAANATNAALDNTQADSDTVWEALVGTGSGAASTDG
ncbi:c5fa8fc6-8b20-41a6-b4f6-a45eea199a66 [Sclerotinia trifoliorum]|uniref:C5fa8fc6-8b20-41a6-b4f6-a45eea199a66 n=1 Tax=Sclerotinia trifoliorum TaxID=28548 RepID=A0A8H2VS64_9HELO|nr:c5fa8fc6-8b20-41a6-b4f6-a45eea199a66 [Sclerotinia trifoliorum]